MDSGRIALNVQKIRERIARACTRSGRSPADVQLLAVTKTVGIEEIRCLASLGIRDFGENRVPDGLEKIRALEDLELCWHFIGHLQRNKAAKALTGFHRIHSVESPKLIDVLQQQAERDDMTVDVWLEVNISGEASKYGLQPDETAELARRVFEADRLHLRGLMTMAPWTEDPEEARPVFRGLRELRDQLMDETGAIFPGLSMGMTNDFEVAIEEGATIVRIGSAFFA